LIVDHRHPTDVNGASSTSPLKPTLAISDPPSLSFYSRADRKDIAQELWEDPEYNYQRQDSGEDLFEFL
jgi:hypothetical protein